MAEQKKEMGWMRGMDGSLRRCGVVAEASSYLPEGMKGINGTKKKKKTRGEKCANIELMLR